MKKGVFRTLRRVYKDSAGQPPPTNRHGNTKEISEVESREDKNFWKILHA